MNLSFPLRRPFIVSVLVFSGMLQLLFVSCKDDEPTNNSSAYITRVFSYVYGPGQNAKQALPSDTANFVGEPSNDKGWLYLGGFGGYVVAGFDHNVKNVDGPDFEVFALQAPSPQPAVVYVMPDSNGDGLPNDTWYELKGNQFDNSIRHYWVRYYKAETDSANITWKDSEGNTGELISGYGSAWSSGWWWPSTTTDSITFSGTRLPDSYVNTSTTSTQYWTVPPGVFTRGYADNLDGTDYETTIGGNKLDISNAVDSLGNPVNLTEIRFIKVQTGVFQQAGWLNEVSSEIRGAKDLNW